MPELALAGCMAEPLISYLKGLGVMRLVSEQADQASRCFWQHGILVLQSRFDQRGLQEFLEREYRPTPILVPWSGGDFFGVSFNKHPRDHKTPPTSTGIVEAFLATTSMRLRPYREAIRAVLDVMKDAGVAAKSDIEGSKGKALKRSLLARLRSSLPDAVCDWLDTAATIEQEQAVFNILLGSGGGSDGNAHFSDNFMQNLWDCLPDFDEQRVGHRKQGLIENSIFGEPVMGLSERTSALFDSGAVGGPNASSGFEGGSLVNPWNFILGLEGTLFFAGSVTKKLGAAAGSAFPFTVSLSAGGYGTATQNEEGQREIWLPLWERAAGLGELRTMFAEGRAQVGSRASRTGSDFGRALSSYGVDRGIGSFARYAFVKGRVGGENYHTAVALGRFDVRGRAGTDLLLEADSWIEKLRRVARDKDAPPRFGTAVRRIDAAILDYCRLGASLSSVLRALGAAEREIANDPKRRVLPCDPLSTEWIADCDDNSPEYRLAVSLASMGRDLRGNAGAFRTDIEPVVWKNNGWRWSSGERIWTSAPLTTNLTALLARRVMEGAAENLPHPALRGGTAACDEDMASFLWGRTDDGLIDDELIEEMLWGLALVDRRKNWPVLSPTHETCIPLPRSYALLKLAFLPWPLHLKGYADTVSIPTDPEVIGRLRASDVRGAVRLAVRRLRASGLVPLINADETLLDPAIDGERLAAALLFPIRPGGLVRRVLREHRES